METPTRGFDASTAVERIDDLRFSTDIDPAWWVGRGPNGGYLAALLLRALTATVDDPDRAVRSLTVHYLAAPGPGPATIESRLMRAGRSVSNVSARLEQGGRQMCEALAVFSRPWPGPAWNDAPPPATTEPFDPDRARVLSQDRPLFGHWEIQPCVGSAMWSGSQHAHIGGWLRSARPQPVDAVVAAAMTDAYPPVVFTQVESPVAAPTLDLTIHFRRPLPYPGMAGDDPVLVEFRGRVCHDGLFEEDGSLWAPDGTLLVQSRQLAVVFPLPG